MAVYTNSKLTYATRNHEEVVDRIINTDPFETPVVALAGRKTVSRPTWDFLTESLPTPDETPKEEAFVYAPAASVGTTTNVGITQINSENAVVSKTQLKSKAVGQSDALAHQMALKSKALKITQEKRMLSNSTASLGNATTARSTGGLQAAITTNVTTAADFTKAAVDEAMLECWQNGATGVDHLIASGVNRMAVSQFQPRTGAQTTVSNGTLLGGGITIYTSDFGDLKIVPSRYLGNDVVLLLDFDYVKSAYLRAFERDDPKIGADAVMQVITSEWGLEVSNEKSLGKIVIT